MFDRWRFSEFKTSFVSYSLAILGTCIRITQDFQRTNTRYYSGLLRETVVRMNLEFSYWIPITVLIGGLILFIWWMCQREPKPRALSGPSVTVTANEGGTTGSAMAFETVGDDGKPLADRRDVAVTANKGGKSNFSLAAGGITEKGFQTVVQNQTSAAEGAAAELGVWNESYSFPGTVDPCEPDWDASLSKDVYNMNTKPKGLFFLVNNFNFEEARKRNHLCEDRHGTHTDAKALTELFKQFGFQVDQRDDLTAEAMQNAFKEQVQRCAKKPYSCFCAAVLSHGKDGGVVGTDGEFLSTKDIMDMFHGDKCPKLLRKPKVFFIQACQGKDKDKGCEVPDGWTINDALLDVMAKGKNQTDGPGGRTSGTADFFLAVATVSGYVSWRHTENGSYFISALVKIFRTEACKCDLQSLMTKVNNELVLSRQQKDYVQVAGWASTLTKPLYFTPGLPSAQ